MRNLVSRIGLADVLGELRNELAEAQATGAGQTMRFEIQEAELEFTVEISREAKPGAKVKFNVITIGAFEAGVDTMVGDATTHRITLRLGVVDEQTGQRAKVGESRHDTWTE